MRGSREPFRAAWLVTAVLVALALPCAEPAQRSCPSPHVLGTGDGGVSPLVACDGAGEGALGGALPLLFGGRIDLAGADAAALDVLPGVGPALASAILAERERAPFCTLGELERVHGIGPRTLARLAPWLEVGRDPRCARLSDPGGGP